MSRLSCRLAVLLIAWAAGCARPASTPPASGALRIVFLDVGQGDAAVVVSPEGRRILVDAGPNPSQVAQYLQANGHDTLDLAIASHAHDDHIGGMEAVLRTVHVRAYLDNGVPHTTSTYRRTMTAVEQSRTQYLAAEARTISVGSARVRILPMPPGPGDQNDRSVGVLVRFGSFSVLFTGDSERAELAWWLRSGAATQVSLVKVAHHGADNGTTDDWAGALRPALAVISVGRSNPYGHPSAAAVASWSRSGATVLRTDLEGAITVSADTSGAFTATNSAGTVLFRFNPGRVGQRP